MWFRRNGSFCAVGRKIFLFVMIAHLSVVLFLAVYQKLFAPKSSHKTIAVHTIRPTPILPTTTAPQQKTTKTVAVPAPVVKEKKTVPPKNPPPPALRENQQNKKTNKAVAPLKEEAPTPAFAHFDVKIPELIKKEELLLPEPEGKMAMSYSYGDNLTQFLQQMLQLPEVGEVRARLSVSAQGEIRSVEILDARSSKNAEWLKKELLHLSLPEFRQFGILEPILDFTITFHNVENF